MKVVVDEVESLTSEVKSLKSENDELQSQLASQKRAFLREMQYLRSLVKAEDLARFEMFPSLTPNGSPPGDRELPPVGLDGGVHFFGEDLGGDGEVERLKQQVADLEKLVKELKEKLAQQEEELRRLRELTA